MMGGRAQIDVKIEVEGAAGSEKDRRTGRRQSGPVGRDQDIGGERVALALAHRAKARRADLLADFHQQLDVEPKLAPLPEDLRERGKIDRVLALVVGGAAPVPAIAFDADLPWRKPVAPLRIVAVDDVAVTIGENRRTIVAFMPLREKKRRAARRIVEESPRESSDTSIGAISSVRYATRSSCASDR
jgi:hypothetical protein